MFISVTLSNQFTVHISFYYKIWNNIGVNVPTVGKFQFYIRKLSELWLVHNPELHVEVSEQLRDSTCCLPIYTFMNELNYQ